ncbi:low molecular weight protein-tyrosine-phosphatase [Rosistilla carotiformis]|uniref:low molecular weight protein-tyrosine-phosphatase n=1 Tax=Rosistilla carotiformis TaxID=2528017 RepID=UPI001E2B8561|nr:low molecular weight protein-tyrosine-phosphatase [Rosistilla carotiformis]
MKPCSILFVCMGNICRSPAAEGVMRRLVEAEGLEDRITIDSAGTIGFHTGKAADRRMRAAAQQRGLELTSRARKVTADDLKDFDRVIAMDAENARDLIALHGGSDARIEMLSSYLDDAWPGDVPDPYYGGEEGFEFVLNMLEAACPKILASLTTESS